MAMQAKGHVTDEIQIAVPPVTHHFKVPQVIGAHAVLQLGLANEEAGVFGVEEVSKAVSGQLGQGIQLQQQGRAASQCWISAQGDSNQGGREGASHVAGDCPHPSCCLHRGSPIATCDCCFLSLVFLCQVRK
jgi:hypothetical protein